MHSTADALLHSTNEWYRKMDDGMLNIAVFLDLIKAFDTVNHEVLIGKLSFLGMQPCALNLITSYLENRSQRCYVNGYLSKPQKIDYGVPQGSILGPLLFLIYINDLPNCIEKSTVRMFADDTTLTASSIALPEIESKINHHLNNVQKWLLANKLCLNLIKTEYLLIGSKQKISKLTNDPVIQIANRLVNRVTSKKSLGVVIDQYLLWDNYLDEICKKCRQVLERLGNLNHMLLVKHLYLSIVLWFNRILITAALYGSQLVLHFRIDFSHSKIEQLRLY